MMLDGGKVGNTYLLSRKSVELMTHDQLGKISSDQGFGLGFGVDGVKAPLSELGSPGEYEWGGFFYTAFTIDPKEQMIVIFMGQLHPTGNLTLNRQVHALAYQILPHHPGRVGTPVRRRAADVARGGPRLRRAGAAEC
jgi:CubicO group peptidase (beta-lactamase class C family)